MMTKLTVVGSNQEATSRAVLLLMAIGYSRSSVASMMSGNPFYVPQQKANAIMQIFGSLGVAVEEG